VAYLSGMKMPGKLVQFGSTKHAQVERPGLGLKKDVSTALIFNNPLLCLGLKHLLSGTEFAVAETSSPEVLLTSQSSRPSPDLFIVDGNAPVEQVIETVESIKGSHSKARIVLLADTFDLQVARSGRNAGVDGFCVTANGCEALIKSLELVMLGEAILPATLLDALFDNLFTMPAVMDSSHEAVLEQTNLTVRKLSKRETEILSSLSAGDPNKIIARNFGVAEATVKNHVKAILKKIGAANRTQAAIWAKEHLLEPKDSVSEGNVSAF
jgi:two-component system, NarL family, nitrate/nitrite response regulator NarL